MKALGYIRVSTSDQSNSLEVQTKKIQDYCKFKELELTNIFVDSDVSGGTPFIERKGGEAANKSLNEVKIIISVKPDRLFRSTKDALITVDEWGEKDVSLHIIDLGGNSIDTKTALGRMFFIQAVSMAEFERLLTSERTKAVLNHKKATGKVYCGSLFGYDKQDGKMIPNEPEQRIIEIIKDFNTSGLSNDKIALTLNTDGFHAKNGGKFFPSTIKNILKQNNELQTEGVSHN